MYRDLVAEEVSRCASRGRRHYIRSYRSSPRKGSIPRNEGSLDALAERGLSGPGVRVRVRTFARASPLYPFLRVSSRTSLSGAPLTLLSANTRWFRCRRQGLGLAKSFLPRGYALQQEPCRRCVSLGANSQSEAARLLLHCSQRSKCGGSYEQTKGCPWIFLDADASELGDSQVVGRAVQRRCTCVE